MELERVFKATYILKGDGNLALVAHEKIERKRNIFIQVGNFVTLRTAEKELFPLSPGQQQ